MYLTRVEMVLLAMIAQKDGVEAAVAEYDNMSTARMREDEIEAMLRYSEASEAGHNDNYAMAA